MYVCVGGGGRRGRRGGELLSEELDGVTMVDGPRYVAPVNGGMRCRASEVAAARSVGACGVAFSSLVRGRVVVVVFPGELRLVVG